MKSNMWLVAVGAVAVSCVAGAAEAPSTVLKEEFPFGVFWAWDRCKFNGRVMGADEKAYAEKTLKIMRDLHCDAAWFVHGPDKDAEWIMPMMERYGVKGMVGSELINFYYGNDLCKGPDFVLKRARNTANVFSSYPSLLGYVLKDEPLLCDVQHTDFFYEQMRRADPLHEAAVIAMPPQFQSYIEDTRLSVVCTDIYHFGGKGSRWIPQPAAESRRTFRETVHNAVTAASRRGKHAWIMPMVFGNTWGPHYWDKDGRHWALPGAYFHWRMPTVAEARWQVWEAVRGGAKGVLFYLLNNGSKRLAEEDMQPGSPGYKRVVAELEEYHLVEKFGKGVLSQEKVELDPADTLTFPGGDPTDQFKAIGGAFGALAPHKGRLLKSRRATIPVFYPEAAFVKAQTFERDGESGRLGVVVSDDIDSSRTVRIRVAKNVSRVCDLNRGELNLTAIDGTPYKVFEVTLEPGGGAILAAEFADGYAGVPLLHEDFSNGSTKGAVDDKVAEKARYAMFGIAADWQLKLKKGADATKPAFKISRLTHPKSASNTVFMNVNRKEATGTIFLDMLGTFKQVEVTVVTDAAATAEKTDVLHTGEKSAATDTADASRRVIWKTGDFLPVAIPVGATGLEFRLGDRDDSLREVNLWYVHGVK